MSYYRSKGFKSSVVAFVLFNAAFVTAEEKKTADGLIEFKSEAGKFSIHLPAKPVEEVVEVGAAKEKQHQFTAGADKGAYIVSYQEIKQP